MLLQKVGQFEHNGPLSLSLYMCTQFLDLSTLLVQTRIFGWEPWFCDILMFVLFAVRKEGVDC